MAPLEGNRQPDDRGKDGSEGPHAPLLRRFFEKAKKEGESATILTSQREQIERGFGPGYARYLESFEVA